jgi:hypothetical protein
MRTDRTACWIAAVLTALCFAGCEPKKDVQEKQRLQQEEQAEKDEAKANQAITNMNQKMFSTMNSQPAPSASNTAPSQPPPPAPAPSPNAPKP